MKFDWSANRLIRWKDGAHKVLVATHGIFSARTHSVGFHLTCSDRTGCDNAKSIWVRWLKLTFHRETSPAKTLSLEAATFSKQTDEELGRARNDSFYQGLKNREGNLSLILLSRNFPGQIPWKWSVLGHADLWGLPKIVDERVILLVLATVFHALQLPYYHSSPSSQPSVMVSRIPEE